MADDQHAEWPHSEALRTGRRMDAPGTWFVTKCVWPKRPVLAEDSTARTVTEALGYLASGNRLLLAAFVVMPDHWHALLAPRSADPGAVVSLPDVMHSLDTWVGRHTVQPMHRHGTGWEPGYHDTRIRSRRQFRYVTSYIESNPVRRGLVAEPGQWVWSSANPRWANLLTRPWPWGFERDE